MDNRDDYITQALAVRGGHLAIGRGGYTLHFKQGATNSGYAIDEMKARCLARGLPVIDTRDIRDPRGRGRSEPTGRGRRRA